MMIALTHAARLFPSRSRSERRAEPSIPLPDQLASYDMHAKRAGAPFAAPGGYIGVIWNPYGSNTPDSV